jgi:hypothetical protein
VPRPREHGMVGDLVLDAEPAEPAIRQVDLHFGADAPLRTNGKHIADDEGGGSYRRVRTCAFSSFVISVRIFQKFSARTIKNARGKRHTHARTKFATRICCGTDYRRACSNPASQFGSEFAIPIRETFFDFEMLKNVSREKARSGCELHIPDYKRVH